VPVVRTFYGSSRAEARHSRRLRQRLYHGSMAVFERRSERRARAVVGISDAMQSDFRRPMIVIPCGYDPTLFSPGGPKTARPAILFVGDLGTRKRADLLLQAFAESVRPAIDGAELWMVTSDPVDRPGVRWLGRLSPDALAAAYREAWVLCLPSRYEGFGVPCVEAMASGTPVVATASGGTEEILENGRWGRLVQDSDVGRALVDVIASQEYRAQLAALGLERAKQYDIARIADQYEALYRGLSP
jgi:glycosyltransferase involved in cell wall biosynthesis